MATCPQIDLGDGGGVMEPAKRGTCTWIDGDPRVDGRWCGQPVTKPGSAWCAAHRSRVFETIEIEAPARRCDLVQVAA